MSRSIEPTPPPLKYSLRNSKRRVYSGSNSLLMDPDVVEIPPPVHHPSKLIKQKKAIPRDVIDIDNDEDSTDLMFIGENIGGSNKGKTIEAIHDGSGHHQAMDVSDDIFCPPGVEQFGTAGGVESSNGYGSASHNIINVDGHNSDLSYDEDDFNDVFSDDFMDMDDYSAIQAHFDHVDIPAGIEAPIPWMPGVDLGPKKSLSNSFYPWYDTHPDAQNSHVMPDFPQLPWAIDHHTQPPQGISVGSSSMQTKMGATVHPSGTSQLFPQSGPGKNVTTSQHGGGKLNLNLSLGVDSSKPQWPKEHFHSKKSSFFAGSDYQNYQNFFGNPEVMKTPPEIDLSELPYWAKSESAKKTYNKEISFHSNILKSGGQYPSPGTESANIMWKNPPPSFIDHTAHSGFFYPFNPLHPHAPMHGNTWGHSYARDGNNETTADLPIVTISEEDRDEILRKFKHFKQFDTVEDASDHFYARSSHSLKQNSKNWSKKIQEEWKILEKHLPDTIFVRVYESRMDLMRAVIIGAEGTPYHDGLFFFDVSFPSGYPNVPPQVHYHSGGLRLNPNLYNCGKVCLSLLNTWSGNKNEKWLPGVSTVLQVLVSIQGLILNTKPYFNEPGYSRMSGSAAGEARSLLYNEETFILSLKTMMYMMRKPPKHFEDFVAGHFCCRANDILVACKAYMEGAQVGCLVKGGVQDVDEGDRSCSEHFKQSIAGFLKKLVGQFAQVGAKDCEKFLPPGTIQNNQMSGMPEAAPAT